jgi:hypothetical protein
VWARALSGLQSAFTAPLLNLNWCLAPAGEWRRRAAASQRPRQCAHPRGGGCVGGRHLPGPRYLRTAPTRRATTRAHALRALRCRLARRRDDAAALARREHARHGRGGGEGARVERRPGGGELTSTHQNCGGVLCTGCVRHWRVNILERRDRKWSLNDGQIQNPSTHLV